METHLDYVELIARLPSYWKPPLDGHYSNGDGANQPVNLRSLLFAVRDMPYGRPQGEPRTVERCVTQWRGTCSTKHLAAKELLEALGFKPVMWLAAYLIDFSEPYYPEWLSIKAKDTCVYDVHNYLTCDLMGVTTIIDLTFPKPLKIFGLPVTENWKLGDNFLLCCKPEKNVMVKDIDKLTKAKQDWLRKLNGPDELELREFAIQAIADLVENR